MIRIDQKTAETPENMTVGTGQNPCKHNKSEGRYRYFPEFEPEPWDKEEQTDQPGLYTGMARCDAGKYRKQSGQQDNDRHRPEDQSSDRPVCVET